VKPALTFMAAALFLWGCGSSQGTPSPLQRYDKMRRELHWITSMSGRVAGDARNLEVTMARGNPTAIRARAVRLKADARPYSRRAGAAGNAVRALAAEAPSGPVRLYLLRVSDALSRQWVEGVALRFVADQAWSDPLSLRSPDAQRLAADVAWARKAARQAVLAADAARVIRREANGQFQYTAPTPTG
jgi:hypothetical protein